MINEDCNRIVGHVALILGLVGSSTSARAQAINVQWIGPSQGNWSNAANWSAGVPQNDVPPGATYEVRITGGASVLLDAEAAVNSLHLSDFGTELTHRDRTLATDDLTLSDATYLFQTGILDAATVQIGAGSRFVALRPDGGESILRDARFQGDGELVLDNYMILDNITLAMDASGFGTLEIPNTLTLDGATLERNIGSLNFNGTAPRIAGTGIVRFTDEGYLWNHTDERIWIEPGVEVEFQERGVIRGATNEGTIRKLNRGELIFDGINHGLIDAQGTVRIGLDDESHPESRNEGMIHIGPRGRVIFEGTRRADSFGAMVIERTEGRPVDVGGRVELDGQTLDFSSLPFPAQNAFYGVISNGTITSQEPMVLGDVTLSNITLGSPLRAESHVWIEGTLNLAGQPIDLQDGLMPVSAGLDSRVMGPGKITTSGIPRSVIGNEGMDIGPDVVFEVQPGTGISFQVGKFEGTLECAGAASRCEMVADQITGTLVVDHPDALLALGSFSEPDRMLEYGGTVELRQGTLEFRETYTAAVRDHVTWTAGQIVYRGNLLNQAQTFELQSFERIHGNVIGGTVVGHESGTPLIGTLADVVVSGQFRVISDDGDQQVFLTGNSSLADATVIVDDERTRLYVDQLVGSGTIRLQNLTGIINRGPARVPEGIVIETAESAESTVWEGPLLLQGRLSLGPAGSSMFVREAFNAGTIHVGRDSILSLGAALNPPPEIDADRGGLWQLDENAQIKHFDAFTLRSGDQVQGTFGTRTMRPLLSTTERLTLAGSLELQYTGTRRPRGDRVFQLLEGSDLVGDFDQFSIRSEIEGLEWDTSQLLIDGTVRAIGEPIETIAQTSFVRPALGDTSYSGPLEINFETNSTPAGARPEVGVVEDDDARFGRTFKHQSVAATTTFETIDLRAFESVELEAGLMVADTGYESGDFVSLTAVHGDQRVPVFAFFGASTSGVSGTTFHRVEIPNDWTHVSLIFSSFSNSSAGSESYALDFIELTGIRLNLAGDFDGNGVLEASDVDRLMQAIRQVDQDAQFDLTGDGMLDREDLRVWVEDLRGTYFGDANLDGSFSSSDLVAVFQAGQYENPAAGESSWGTGDWNGDGQFGSGDLVLAFQSGGYESGPRAMMVPEPTRLLIAPLLACWGCLRRRPNGPSSSSR